jgi:xanthine dehydrogenase accessory factor
MMELAGRLCAILGRGEPAVVATILSRQGSAPRTAGSKMVVEKSGRFDGTIGGGKLEAEVLARAHRVLTDGRPQMMRFDLTRDNIAAMDMICGGTVEVLVDRVAAQEDAVLVFETWRRLLSQKKTGILVTVITESPSGLVATEHCLILSDGSTAGGWPLSDGLLNRLAATAVKGGAAHVMSAENARLLLEPVSPSRTLLIFGAGHVSMPTARLAVEVGFRVVVVDDRKEFANRDRFPAADEIIVPDDFASVLSGISVDEGTFVVIVTRGHRHDKDVLAQVLRTGAGYIGMIGSRRKRDAIYRALRAEGFTGADFDRVYCPVGLSIGAETPQEIAVSIVAQLIAYRAGALP